MKTLIGVVSKGDTGIQSDCAKLLTTSRLPFVVFKVHFMFILSQGPKIYASMFGDC